MQHWEQRQCDWGWSKWRCTEWDNEVGTDMMQSSAMSIDQEGLAMYSTARTRKIRHFRYCPAKRQIKSNQRPQWRFSTMSVRSVPYPFPRTIGCHPSAPLHILEQVPWSHADKRMSLQGYLADWNTSLQHRISNIKSLAKEISLTSSHWLIIKISNADQPGSLHCGMAPGNYHSASSATAWRVCAPRTGSFCPDRPHHQSRAL